MDKEKSIQNKKNKKFICPTPFEFVEIHPDGEVYPCHYALEYRYSIGNIFKQPNFEKIWNSKKAREFRRSILEQEYKYCDPHICCVPKQYDDDEKFDIKTKKFPQIIEFNPDMACNVRCVICRDKQRKITKHQEHIWSKALDNTIMYMMKDAKIAYFSGVGEVFCSPISKKMITKMSEVYPDIKYDILTNGILMDKKHCDELGITDKLHDVDISIHAATEETYNKIVRDGNFKKVMKNLEWISEKYKKGEINHVNINFVVMQTNYKEMIDFQKLANKLGVDTCFWEYRFWGDFLEADDHYAELAVFDKRHPEHEEFLKIVQNPIFNKNCEMNDVIKCEDEIIAKSAKKESSTTVEHPPLVLTKEQKKLEFKDKSELPKKIRLDMSTICQLKCKECYMVKETELIKKQGCGFGFLKFEDFKKLVDENDFESIEVSNSGEIFLNPDFIKIIKYAHKKGIELTAINGVNMNTLSEKQAEALVKYGFADISVSIDGATQETYQQYRVNGNIDTVFANIERINRYKKIYKSELPRLVYKFIIWGHNEHELELARKKAKKLKMEIEFERPWNDEMSPIKDQKAADIATGTTWKRDCATEQLEKFNKGEVMFFDCDFFWNQPQVNWDGKLLGCCALYWDDFGANVFKDGYMNALNTPKYVYAKNMLLGKAKPRADIPCVKCEIYQEFLEKNQWMKMPCKKKKKNAKVD